MSRQFQESGKVNPDSSQLIVFLVLFMLGICTPLHLSAHQQPTTIVLLDVRPDRVRTELQIPLSELDLAFGHNVAQNPDTLLDDLNPQFKDYLLGHIHAQTGAGIPWTVKVGETQIAQTDRLPSEAQPEITVYLDLLPPAGASTRQFLLNYDLIMEKVVTHRALVSIRSDWAAGNVGGQPIEAGVIMVDTTTRSFTPLAINLEKGSLWSGFAGMLRLGMQHIKEGTDHLLFLLVLLLPSTLLYRDRRWTSFGGARDSITRLLKIVTAFTIGHSLTLLIGALGWLRLPPQPVEVLIAVSILISAVHAVRPIFPGREMYVAAGFGLVHGLAFASVLSELNLGAGIMAISILGFNLGIELMQIFVIALVVPWLILLSQTLFYKPVRIGGAAFAAIAAAAWITERVAGNSNALGDFIQHTAPNAPLGILILALIAVFAFSAQHLKKKRISANAELDT